ncbi:MAG: hypothetical protein RLN90_09605 [Balneolaceae bacterium]
MASITKDYVKQNFPQWKHYADYDPVAADSNAALDNQIANAEDELAEYIVVDESTITNSLKRHLFKIVRYNLFMLAQGDTDFERDPQIVAEYKSTIKSLVMLRDGERPVEASTVEKSKSGITLTSKTRTMGAENWRTDLGKSVTTLED